MKGVDTIFAHSARVVSGRGHALGTCGGQGAGGSRERILALRDVFEMATLGGAATLGRQDNLGSLRAKAEHVPLERIGRPTFIPLALVPASDAASYCTGGLYTVGEDFARNGAVLVATPRWPGIVVELAREAKACVRHCFARICDATTP